MPNIKLTKQFIESAICPDDKSQIIFIDTKLKSLALRVTQKGVKSFVFNGTVNGKQIRKVIGGYGALTLEQARCRIIELLQHTHRG